MEISRILSQVWGCSAEMTAPTRPLKDPYLLALGDQIRQRRLAQGWSQDEFAARAGMHRTHPTKLENGLLDPRLSTLRRVADVLGIEVRLLLPTSSEIP